MIRGLKMESSTRDVVEFEEEEEEEEQNGPSRWRPPSDGGTTTNRFIIHPQNWWYLGWKQFILIWAVYSSFFTPLEFGFFRGLPEKLFLLDSAGQLAFFIDIFLHFFLAFKDPHSHRLVSNHNQIAIRYLKSRFILDFLGCLPLDAIYKACNRNEVVRYLLWIRLSRALRVTEFFEALEKDIRINYLFTRIIKLFVVELYCTHTAACFFYYLATTLPPAQEGYTWIGSLKMGDYNYSEFRDIDLWTRYITSLYFAIVTMATVGYGDIHAVNNREMIFIIMYISGDMILGAYLLGNMAALIVKGSRTERFRDKMTDIIKYMNKHDLGKQISKEIKGHVRLQYETSYNEASVLQDIPATFKAKISQKLYEPYIKEVPLFKGCSLPFIKQIAIKVQEELFLPGEVIIEEGNIADQLYIVCYGKLEDVERSENEAEKCVRTLEMYSSLNELSVLCNIPVPDTVRVAELSKLLRIDKQSLTDILEIHFADGRIILDNLLEGNQTRLRKKILESDLTLHVAKHEFELALRLNFAVYSGDLYRVKRLVASGINPNNTDYDGRSPLHIAAIKGFADLVQYLLQKEARINATDNNGNTPLFEAIKNGHDGVVSMLVEAGAFLDMDNAGNCLCMAVAKGDIEFLKRVLDNGVNPNSRNYDLRTPLHIAAAEGLYSIAKLILEAGGSVSSKDRWGNTPLDEARVGGSKKLIKILEDAISDKVHKMFECFACCEIEARKGLETNKRIVCI
ncbi:putative cyclic nucleotide-binding domain, potassium channel, voltage-dependent, EAG/ELK/ERG [Helianthus annuus]|nr:putative cyclic nucleotide-binding domain, potassium channel, voltage-dependent, EAG/ELK/ERG [Helianthus annuus]